MWQIKIDSSLFASPFGHDIQGYLAPASVDVYARKKHQRQEVDGGYEQRNEM